MRDRKLKKQPREGERLPFVPPSLAPSLPPSSSSSSSCSLHPLPLVRLRCLLQAEPGGGPAGGSSRTFSLSLPLFPLFRPPARRGQGAPPRGRELPRASSRCRAQRRREPGPGRTGPCRGRRSGAGSRAPGCRGAGSRELGAGSRAAILPGPCLAAGLRGVSLLFRGLGVPGAFRRCVGDAPECVGTVIAASRPQSRENCCGAPEFPSLPVPSLGARRMSQATSVVN